VCAGTQVLYFENPSDADAWLLANPMRVTGSLYLEDRAPSVIAYGIQTNSTTTADHGRYEDPNFTYQIPLQVAAEREIARMVTGGIGILNSLIFEIPSWYDI